MSKTKETRVSGKYNSDCIVFTEDVEETAMRTIRSIVDDEVSKGVPIRIMPDVHAGVDIVIGFTMPMTDRVNPNHIGVDIGCGVLSVPIEKPSMSIAEIDRAIKSVIPMGFKHRRRALIDYDEEYAKLAKKIGQDFAAVSKQIGTLGGGNHFVEMGEADGQWYLFIHSGSRNFGLQVCNYHIGVAKRTNRSNYLYGQQMRDYLADMKVAQRFANENRRMMAQEIMRETGIKSNGEMFDTVHNYLDFRRDMIRKGAISAEKGEKLAIPLNMRDGVIIGVGKGNPHWNYSAPHGAGRVLSRRRAKSKLSMRDFIETMEGVYSTSINRSTLDEAPFVYKDSDFIEESVSPTVDVLKVVKPLLNVKS